MIYLQLLFTMALSYSLIRLIIKYAHSLKFLDVPNERSHHCDIIPKGAGIGFVTAFFISSMLFYLDVSQEFWYIYLSILMIFTVGIVDDRVEVSPKLKFLVIFTAVAFLSFFGVGIFTLGEWFGFELTLPFFIALPFTMFALAGFTNALNLIDGLDGLSSSISIVIISIFGFIGLEHNNVLMITIASTILVTLLAFLTLNWNPAKVFMGDSGSLTLGFIISILAVLSIKYIHPIVILYLAALPILDTLIVMIRRIRRGKSPFSPDKTHIHHILVKFFEGNVKKTVIFLVLMQLVFSSIGYMLIGIIEDDESGVVPLIALVGFGVLFVIFYMIFTGIKRRQQIIDRKQKRKVNKF